MESSAASAESEAKAARLLKNLRKRAEKEGIDPALLDGWSAHVSGANEVWIKMPRCLASPCLSLTRVTRELT
jgi:cobalamin biosynthesis protein CbiG